MTQHVRPTPFTATSELAVISPTTHQVTWQLLAGETGHIVSRLTLDYANPLLSIRNPSGATAAIYRDAIVKAGGLEPLPPKAKRTK